MSVVGILLAAGSSTRFGSNKLLFAYRGKSLYLHAVEALRGAQGIDEVLVVVNPHFPVSDFPLPTASPRCRFVVNPDHGRGMGSSLRAAVRAASNDVEAFVVALADMPAISSRLVAELIAHYRQGNRGIVIPVCRGRRGHPVVLGAALRPELLDLDADVGARQIVGGHPEMVELFETEDEAVLFDVDVPGDVR
jgi:molybdenum cofactor cytidylyltransferase